MKTKTVLIRLMTLSHWKALKVILNFEFLNVFLFFLLKKKIKIKKYSFNV